VDLSGNLFVADTENHTSGRSIRQALLARWPVLQVTQEERTVRAARPGSIRPRTWPWIGPETFYVADTTITRSARWCLRPGRTSYGALAGTSGERRRIGIRGRIFPSGRIVFDSNGDLYVADTDNYTARVGWCLRAYIQTTPQSQKTVTAGSDVHFSPSRPPAARRLHTNGTSTTTAIGGATDSVFN